VAGNSFDVVLVMGPLHHLPRADERHQVLAEAARALRPGGLLIAAAIGRFASLFENAGLGTPDAATANRRLPAAARPSSCTAATRRATGIWR
jgi:SAM-dependent methyltransferase